MTRLRRDLDDMDLLDAAVAKDLRAERAEQVARWERGEALQLEAEAKRRAQTQAWALEANRAQVLETYAAAGVQPPMGDGKTLVSLPLLLSVGWTIQDIHGEKTLVAPQAPPAAEQRGSYKITTPEPKK